MTTARDRRNASPCGAAQLLRLRRAELDELFAGAEAGPVPEGEYRGTLILPLDAVPLRGIAASAGRMAWRGKVFDAGARRAINRVLPLGARAVAAEVRGGPSRLDGRECIVLDYSRTSLVARNIRDELRLLRPGLYLGRAYWHGLRAADFALEAWPARPASRHMDATTISPATPPSEAAMPPPVTPSPLGRRLVVSGLAATAAGPPIPGTAGLAQSTALLPTPRQTTGPFYPVDWSGDADADLVRVSGEAARAQGVVTHLRGRVLDARGEPVPGAVVEIWRCDAFGRYRHPRDRAEGRDPGFQGRGRVPTGPDGGYAFRTIRPVPYPGRTPHIHAAVVAPGRAPLVTQFYVAGEPLNERDGPFNALRDPRQREAVLLRPEPAERIETGALLAGRDIVLG